MDSTKCFATNRVRIWILTTKPDDRSGAHKKLPAAFKLICVVVCLMWVVSLVYSRVAPADLRKAHTNTTTNTSPAQLLFASVFFSFICWQIQAQMNQKVVSSGRSFDYANGYSIWRKNTLCIQYPRNANKQDTIHAYIDALDSSNGSKCKKEAWQIWRVCSAIGIHWWKFSRSRYL